MSDYVEIKLGDTASRYEGKIGELSQWPERASEINPNIEPAINLKVVLVRYTLSQRRVSDPPPDRIATLERELAAAQDATLFPGATLCDTCGFVLTSRVLNVATGNVELPREHDELCPNDGTPMRRMTWSEAYRRQSEVNDAMADRERGLLTELAAARRALVIIDDAYISVTPAGTPRHPWAPHASAEIAKARAAQESK